MMTKVGHSPICRSAQAALVRLSPAPARRFGRHSKVLCTARTFPCETLHLTAHCASACTYDTQQESQTSWPGKSQARHAWQCTLTGREWNEHGYSRGSGEGEQRGAGGEGERSRPWHSRCSFRTPPLAPLPRGRGLPRAAHARSPQPRPRAVRPLARPGPLLWRLPAREPIIASVPRRAGQDLENSPSPRPGRFPGPEAGPGNWRHLAAGPRHPNRNFVSIMLRTVAVNFSQLIRFERFTFCNLEVFYTQF